MFGKLKRREPSTKIIIASCVRDCPRNNDCPRWVVLDQDFIDDKTKKKFTKTIGRCAIVWLPQMLIELKLAIREVRNGKDKG